MESAIIHPQTQMGAVALVVTDLTRSLDYYQTSIGLQLLTRQDGEATLGVGERTLLRLTEQPGAKPVARGRTGLYHFAILLPDRPSLGRLVQNLVTTQTPVTGASDHGVSEALYLDDPDGHGIELYRDRPPAEWPRTRDGELAMTLDPLDAQGLIAAGDTAPPWQGLPAGTRMGHVHLHVANLAAAEAFYVQQVGFDLIQRYGGQASFVAAGGYHHHFGLNTWAGVGAPPPSADAARLLWAEIVLPDEAARAAVVTRLTAAGAAVADNDQGVWVDDPSHNRLRLCVA